MDERCALRPGTPLNLSNSKGQSISCSVLRELGRGGSCIVYEGEYFANTGDKKLIRIKECYPYKLHIHRKSNGALIADADDEVAFEEAKTKYELDFSITNKLFYSDDLYDSIVNSVDIYDFNNSKYIVSIYSANTTLTEIKPSSIKECIELVTQIAKIIEKIHNAGYLYLDIKPDNILFIKNDIQNRVQLFDFDSLVPYDINNQCIIPEHRFRLSYSKGFSAVELQLSKIKHISPATDVFGIGALLFYLLYGESPSALQCNNDSNISGEGLTYNTDNCDDRLMDAIKEFLHYTIASYHKDRYQTMAEAVTQLTAIHDFADPEQKRVFSSRLYKEAGFLGREEEMQAIDKYISDDALRCLFISGMGGIGKSSLIRQYLYERKDRYDSIYLVFHNSVITTITDDHALRINKVRQADIEKDNEYFFRKLQELQSLVSHNTLLVIDNFDGEIDSDFLKLLNLEWKVVVVTRHSYSLSGSNTIEINRIKDQNKLITLFQFYLGRPLEGLEYSLVDQLITKVSGHTLVLELIAKQVANSHIDIVNAMKLADNKGFTNIAPEKVHYEKDNIPRSDTIGSIIDSLFSVNNLSHEKKTVLKLLSVLGITGIPIQQLRKIMDWTSLQDINDLSIDGWIKTDHDIITMHPVIQEAVSRWKWEDQYKAAVQKLLTYFFKEIRMEATRNERPAKLSSNADKNKQFKHTNDILLKLEKKREGSFKKNHSEKESIISSTQMPDLEPLDDSPADIVHLYSIISQAKEILDQCKHIGEINNGDAYLNLLYATVLYIPWSNEEYILAKGNEIIENYIDYYVMNDTSDQMENCEHTNPITKVQLLKRIICLYADKSDYDAAEKLIAKANKIANESKNRSAMAHYYDLVSEYYDIKLDGAYDAETNREKQLLHLTRQNTEKCMLYAKKMVEKDISHLYLKNYLGMITLMIRSSHPSPKEIKKGLDDVKKLIIDNTLPYSSVRFQYHMVCAWYYALILDDFSDAQASIDAAAELYEIICPNELDKIDYLLIPVANIYLELAQYIRAADTLMQAYEICTNNTDIKVYISRGQDILMHLLDVYLMAKKYKSAQQVIQWIDQSNETNIKYGIQAEIPEDIREFVEQRMT